MSPSKLFFLIICLVVVGLVAKRKWVKIGAIVAAAAVAMLATFGAFG